MPEPEVLRADNGAVRVLTINRPQAGNALSVETRATLIGEFEAASGDPTVRAVILTAAGDRHFCTGADLRSPQGAPRPEGVPERIAGDIARGIRVSAQRLIAAILDCEKPVVAAVNGTAAGMGVQVALACDFVLAAESARFIEVYVRRALVPDAGAAYLLPRLVGVHKAKELLMLGDDVSAADALSIGLVNRVVPGESLASEAEALAQRLASGPDPGARADEVVGQPLAGRRPFCVVRGRGHRAGPEHAYRRRAGRSGELRRAPPDALPGLVRDGDRVSRSRIAGTLELSCDGQLQAVLRDWWLEDDGVTFTVELPLPLEMLHKAPLTRGGVGCHGLTMLPMPCCRCHGATGSRARRACGSRRSTRPSAAVTYRTGEDSEPALSMTRSVIRAGQWVQEMKFAPLPPGGGLAFRLSSSVLGIRSAVDRRVGRTAALAHHLTSYIGCARSPAPTQLPT